MTSDHDNTDFLYPFIEGEGADPQKLLIDLAASARGKAQISAALQSESLKRFREPMAEAAVAMAGRFTTGGRMYTFGNGGSSTDATTLAALFARPARGRPLPAWCLAADQAVVTALGNDVGFDLVFSRQIIAHSTSADIAIALSTSGNSDDLLTALEEAKKRGLLTIGFAGHDGGRMQSDSHIVDFCFTVDSQSIHRIQESQALIGFELWSATQDLVAQHTSRASQRAAQPAGGTP